MNGKQEALAQRHVYRLTRELAVIAKDGQGEVQIGLVARVRVVRFLRQHRVDDVVVQEIELSEQFARVLSIAGGKVDPDEVVPRERRLHGVELNRLFALVGEVERDNAGGAVRGKGQKVTGFQRRPRVLEARFGRISRVSQGDCRCSKRTAVLWCQRPVDAPAWITLRRGVSGWVGSRGVRRRSERRLEAAGSGM